MHVLLCKAFLGVYIEFQEGSFFVDFVTGPNPPFPPRGFPRPSVLPNRARPGLQNKQAMLIPEFP